MKLDKFNLIYIKCFIILGSYHVSGLDDILKYEHKHRTHKAVEKANGLWCHRCYTMDINKEYCMNVTRNDTSIHHKCDGDMRSCMVKRVSYSTTTSNSSGNQKVWSLERNCSQKCESGCIIIGERIKLYQCTSCCEGQNFCNGGSEASKTEVTSFFLLIFSNLVYFLVNSYLSLPRFQGERTKIRVCSTCCESSFCNFGGGGSARLTVSIYAVIFSYVFPFALNYHLIKLPT